VSPSAADRVHTFESESRSSTVATDVTQSRMVEYYNVLASLVMAVKQNFLMPHHLATSVEMARNGATCITYKVSKQYMT